MDLLKGYDFVFPILLSEQVFKPHIRLVVSSISRGWAVFRSHLGILPSGQITYRKAALTIWCDEILPPEIRFRNTVRFDSFYA
jgi:hypothetical protein